MPRQARLDIPGTLHHVIVRGIERRKIVTDDQDRQDFVSRMGTIASETETAVYAWALMSNHAHILLRSGPSGLSRYMRRLLSGYAVSYNRRHRRHGHLFQNRYTSIVCEEDPYFKELVRYIHLNPLRAKLVESLARLDRYRWCGHSVLMGRIKGDWQDRDYVLKWFGVKEGEAKKAYRRFVKGGIDQGHRSDLVGGGLIRSYGGWSAVKAMRRLGVHEKSDERILGKGEFVDRILNEADERLKYQLAGNKGGQQIGEVIERVCEEENINSHELRMGSRRRRISQVRAQIVGQLVENFGIPLAEVGRQVGVSTSAISKSLSRRDRQKST
ncbi:MAG: transposase [Thermodesulfobacteriota bacterium]|nr:transposase [Thermodesulfobacteriota bacterium]